METPAIRSAQVSDAAGLAFLYQGMLKKLGPDQAQPPAWST